MVGCTSQAGRSITKINQYNQHLNVTTVFISNNISLSSLESDPTVEYVEKPVTATKRKQSGGEEQGINH